jgi:hypothetical protein
MIDTAAPAPDLLAAAAEKGDRRGVLVAMRSRLIASFGETKSARDLATLSRRILEIDAEIAAFDVAEGFSYGIREHAESEARAERRRRYEENHEHQP